MVTTPMFSNHYEKLIRAVLTERWQIAFVLSKSNIAEKITQKNCVQGEIGVFITADAPFQFCSLYT